MLLDKTGTRRFIAQWLLGFVMVMFGCHGMESPSDLDYENQGARSVHQALAVESGKLWDGPVNVCFQKAANCIGTCSVTVGKKCKDDAGCPKGEVCTATTKKCVDCYRKCTQSPFSVCTNDNDCVGQGVCDFSDANCSQGRACSSDLDCSPPTTVYDEAKTMSLNALNESWASASNLKFVNHGDCPTSPDSSWLKLRLNGTGWGGSCNGIGGHECNFGIMQRGHLQNVVVHEVGHSLGLPHEHQRPDVILCAPFAAQLASCYACRNLNNTCALADYNRCLNKTATGPDPFTITIEGELNERNGIIDNFGSTSTYLPLTVYDVGSAMNYCATPPSQVATRVVDDRDPNKTNWQITEYDALGIEILYPRGNVLKLGCLKGCIKTGIGDVTLRTDGSLQDEWQGRGALSWWRSSLTWKKGSNVVGLNSSLPAASIGTGGTITFSGTNKWQKTPSTITGTGTAVVSNAKWTAIATVAFVVAL